MGLHISKEVFNEALEEFSIPVEKFIYQRFQRIDTESKLQQEARDFVCELLEFSRASDSTAARFRHIYNMKDFLLDEGALKKIKNRFRLYAVDISTYERCFNEIEKNVLELYNEERERIAELGKRRVSPETLRRFAEL
jgi:hypothetical protein